MVADTATGALRDSRVFPRHTWPRGIDRTAFPEEILAAVPAWLVGSEGRPATPPSGPGEPYARRLLHRDVRGEVMLATWRPGAECAPHDHGGATGAVVVLAGEFVECEWHWRGDELVRGRNRTWRTGDEIPVAPGDLHSMLDVGAGGATLHFYAPPVSRMRVFDAALRETLTVHDDCGAWIPTGAALILTRQPWRSRT